MLGQEIPKHRKKAGRKPYVIEWRSRERTGCFTFGWTTYSRYARKKNRDTALKCLQEKEGFGGYGGAKHFEYRAREDER